MEGDGNSGDLRETLQDISDAEGIDLVRPREGVVAMTLQAKGKRPVSDLVKRLIEIDGIVHVGSAGQDEFE
jgi:hypothetical protein